MNPYFFSFLFFALFNIQDKLIQQMNQINVTEPQKKKKKEHKTLTAWCKATLQMSLIY